MLLYWNNNPKTLYEIMLVNTCNETIYAWMFLRLKLTSIYIIFFDIYRFSLCTVLTSLIKSLGVILVYLIIYQSICHMNKLFQLYFRLGLF